MEEKRYLLNLLAQFPNVKESKIQYSKIPVDALSFVKLCRLLSENGRVLETDETAHSVIAALSASPTSMNEALPLCFCWIKPCIWQPTQKKAYSSSIPPKESFKE